MVTLSQNGFSKFSFSSSWISFHKICTNNIYWVTYLYQASNSFEMEWDTKHALHLHTHRKPCACVPHGHSPFRYHLLTWQCSRGKGNWKVLRYNSFSFFTIKLKKNFISILKDVTSCGFLIWFYHRSLSLHFHNLWVLTG